MNNLLSASIFVTDILVCFNFFIENELNQFSKDTILAIRLRPSPRTATKAKAMMHKATWGHNAQGQGLTPKRPKPEIMALRPRINITGAWLS